MRRSVFFFPFPLAKLWKNLVLLCPSAIEFSISFIQLISSLNTMPCHSPLISLRWTHFSFVRSLSHYFGSRKAISLTSFSFSWGIIPNISSFQLLRWILMYWSSLKSLACPTHWVTFRPPILERLLELWSHRLSNLKGVGPPFGLFESTKSGQWSETGLGRPFKLAFGWFYSQSLVKKILLILLH